jgi:Fe-S-cluster-containing hydrogenase component 2
MAFAVHITKEHCTSCINCVVACPGDVPELHTVDPVINYWISVIRSGISIISGFRGKFLRHNGAASGRAHTVLSELLVPGVQKPGLVCNKKQREG